jgi:hypothetical protein
MSCGLSDPFLVKVLGRGLRSGNWFRLRLSERAVFRCALWLTRARGSVRNRVLAEQVLAIANKLLRTFASKVAEAGRRRAAWILNSYGPRGVFGWVPELKGWLEESSYILYLGISQVNPL